MEENPNVNRALSALLKELEHIKDLTSMADGYRTVAHELSSSLEKYHRLNNTHIEQLRQSSEDALKANSENINLAQEQFAASLSRIEEICNDINTRGIINHLELLSENVNSHSLQITEEIKNAAKQQLRITENIEQNSLTLSKDISTATQSISQEINVLKDSINEVVRDSFEHNQQMLSNLFSKVENQTAELGSNIYKLLSKQSSEIAEHKNSVIAHLKENNENMNNELLALHSSISNANNEIRTLRKVGIAVMVGMIILVGAVVLSICL